MRRHRETHGRMKYEDAGRDGNKASTRQRTPRIPGNHRKPEERHGTDSPSESPWKNQLCLHPDFKLLTSRIWEIWENKLPLFPATQFVVIHYSSPRKLIQQGSTGRGQRRASGCLRDVSWSRYIQTRKFTGLSTCVCLFLCVGILQHKQK